MRVSEPSVPKSKRSHTLLFTLLTLAILAGAGYARLRVLSHNTWQYYDADALARNLQAQFDPRVVYIFEPMFCSEEKHCVEVRVLPYESDPSIQDKVAAYVLNMCDGPESKGMPCRKKSTGLLNQVDVYMHDYRSRACVRKLEINRNSPKSVVIKTCDSPK